MVLGIATSQSVAPKFVPKTSKSLITRVARFCSSRRRHTRLQGDWSSDVCSSDLVGLAHRRLDRARHRFGGLGIALGRGLLQLAELLLQRCRGAVDGVGPPPELRTLAGGLDRKSTRLNSSHLVISYAVFCLKKKKT